MQICQFFTILRQPVAISVPVSLIVIKVIKVTNDRFILLFTLLRQPVAISVTVFLILIKVTNIYVTSFSSIPCCSNSENWS